MNFCFVTTDSITIKMFYLAIGKRLVAGGHSVTYIANFHNETVTFENDNQSIIDLKMKRGFSLVDFFTMPYRFKKIFKSNNFDLICYSTPNASYYCSQALKRSKYNSVYYQFGLRFEGYNKCSLKRLISFFLEKTTCRNSKSIRSLTKMNSLKNYEYKLVKTSHDVGVVSNGGIPGVDSDVFFKANDKADLKEKFGFNKNDFIMASMGRITKDKGYDATIKAFKELDIDNVKYIIIGSFDNTDPIKKETLLEISNNKNIIVTGFVDQRTANNYLNVSDIFVHMSKREGFGQSVVEAMSCGLVPIVCNVAGPSEVVDEDVGYVIDVDDYKSLKEKIEFLYNNKNERKRMCEHAFKKAQTRYSRRVVVEEICNQLIQMIKH